MVLVVPKCASGRSRSPTIQNKEQQVNDPGENSPSLALTTLIDVSPSLGRNPGRAKQALYSEPHAQLLKFVLPESRLKTMLRGWREGSVAKSTCCSPRGLELSSTPPAVTPAPRDLPLLAPVLTHVCIHTHTQIHTYL